MSMAPNVTQIFQGEEVYLICSTTGVLAWGCLFKEEVLFKEIRHVSEVKLETNIK